MSILEPTTANMEDINSSSAVDIGRLVLIIASFVIGFLGVIGNGIVVLVCIRYPLRGVTNILVCNQSLIDLLSSIVFVLRYGVFSNVPLPDNRLSAEFVCKVWISEYPLWALAVASTGNLVYITIERYIAVFYPIAYRQKFTSFKAKLVALLPWIVGMLHELPWAMAHEIRQDGCSHQWWTDQIGFIIGVIVPINHYVLPLLIMGFVYTRILIKLKSSGPVTSGSSKGNKRSVTNRASRNVIKTMFMVSLTYLICWGPNEILYFYSNMGGYVDWNGILYYYTVVSALCNMCVNPFIYTLNYQDFRVKLGKMMAMFCPEACLCCPCYKDFMNSRYSTDNSVSNISSRV
ncbi:allatostatin-A receptor-like [Amphiura filiformis]|uniref:allatostatin-A receptor-like n=1 Tax=Amphiura filiformis TaxID=82378 RepID=UPI003B20F38C